VVQAQPLGDVVELVARESELLLDDLQEVDLSVRRRRLQAGLHELPVEMRNVEPLSVEVDNSVSLIQELMSKANHLTLTNVEGAEEGHLFFPVPLRCEADDFPALKELVESYVLLPKTPNVGKVGRSFYI
jgi:hypothetical protein